MLAQMGLADAPSPLGPFLIMAVIFGIFYFIAIRPQQQKEREKTKLREALKRGDEVVTVGGLHGRVADVKGSVLWLEVAPNVRVKVERHAVEALSGRPAKTEEQRSAER